MNTQTLEQWAEKWNEVVYTEVCVHVHSWPGKPGYKELFHLSDYVFSSLAGSVVYLVRR